MNNTVRQPVAVEIAATAAKQPKAAKEQGADGDKFMNMLSDAMNGKQDEAVKTQEPETQTESADMVNESEQPLTQEESGTEAPVTDQEDGAANEEEQSSEAAAAAMQMQGIYPAVIVVPQTEIRNEMAAVNPLTGTQSGQMTQASMAVHSEAAATDGFPAHVAQDSPIRTDEAETVTAEKPQTAQVETKPEEIAAQAKPQAQDTTEAATTTAPRTERTEEAAPEIKVNDRQEPKPEHQTAVKPETEQRREPVRQRPAAAPEATQKDAVTVTDADGEAEAQTIRQPRPSVPVHQMVNPRESEAAQAKFDGMLERASRELGQSTAVQEVQPEADVQEETPVLARPVAEEAKPQEQTKQAETPKAEAKLPEEAKPQEQAAVQKSVKTSVADQKPQKEISRADEALLGMTQQKQPEIRPEAIRSEPVPQPHQPRVEIPDQAEQIKAQVIRSMENERTEFQMQLQPEELGKVNVKMVLEGGKLFVEITAFNPKSVELLSKQAESLAASLRAGGSDVSSVNVVAASESASADLNGEYNLDNFQNRFRNGESGHGQHGRSHGTGKSGEQDGSAAQQTEQENPKAPQRILNYSV